MDPTQWGPPAWKFLRAVGHHYPNTPYSEEKQHMIQFLSTLTYILPCAICQEHYKEYLNTHPPDVRSRTALLRWLHELHNAIHQHNGKSPISYYNFMYPVHKQYCRLFWFLLCVGIIGIGIGIYIYVRNRKPPKG